MNRTPVRLLCFALAIALLAAGSPQSSKPATAKVQARTSPSAITPAEAAQDRLCKDLKVVQAELDRLERSLSTATRIQGDLRSAMGRFKAELSAGRTAGAGPGRSPADRTQPLVQLGGRVRAIRADTATLGDALRSELADLKKIWAVVDRDIQELSSPKPGEGKPPRRPCIGEEADRVKERLGKMGSQALGLGSQIEDFGADFKAQGEPRCGDAVTCVSVDCKSCCDAKFRITAPEGTGEYKEQWSDRLDCGFLCDATMAVCKAEGLLKTLEEVSETSNSIARSIVRNLGS